MELMVNNDNILNYNRLSLFMNDLFKKKGKQESDSWRSEINMVSKSKWDTIVDSLANFKECKKIIKTKEDNMDMILFISDKVSTDFVEHVMEEYSKLLFKFDVYFDILVLSDDEYKAWQYNENNVVFWERINA